jgi:hypothetical protein
VAKARRHMDEEVVTCGWIGKVGALDVDACEMPGTPLDIFGLPPLLDDTLMWGDVVVDLADVVVEPEAEGDEDSEGSDGEGEEGGYDDNE